MNSEFNINFDGRSMVVVGDVDVLLKKLLPTSRVVVVTDVNIDMRYKRLLSGYETIVVGFGETSKVLSTVETICRKFSDLGVDRSTFVLGIGGGIVTDITGFAASIYMRGIDFGFVSTTLLGQVDAGIGGKNGVNLDGYKNMIGTFSQPKFVICDPKLLKTLYDREFRAGLGEVVKAGIIADAALFEKLESVTFDELRADVTLLSEVIEAAIKVKMDIVARDEKERGERRKLNFGHTLAHALESCRCGKVHGEAVAMGIVMITKYAVKRGVVSQVVSDRIEALLIKLGFDMEYNVDIKDLMKAISKDKKREGEMLYLILPTAIGSCNVESIPIEEFKSSFLEG